MDAHVIEIIRACTIESDEERATFPSIISRLIASSVERYHADFFRSEKTYFMPSGESMVTPCLPINADVGIGFSSQGVESAVRAIQSQEIKYHEFCRRAMAAGCVGYQVSLAGKRVVYYGRTGESHVEHFPQANV